MKKFNISFKQFLHERFYDTLMGEPGTTSEGKEFKVFYNPTSDELSAFGHLSIRGFIANQDLYIYSENGGEHKYVKEQLGIQSDADFGIYRDNSKSVDGKYMYYVNITKPWPTTLDVVNKVQNNPEIQKMFQYSNYKVRGTH